MIDLQYVNPKSVGGGISKTIFLLNTSGFLSTDPLPLDDATQNWNQVSLLLGIPSAAASNGNAGGVATQRFQMWSLDAGGADIEQIYDSGNSIIWTNFNAFAYYQFQAVTPPLYAGAGVFGNPFGLAAKLFKQTAKLIYGFRWTFGTGAGGGPPGVPMLLFPVAFT